MGGQQKGAAFDRPRPQVAIINPRLIRNGVTLVSCAGPAHTIRAFETIAICSVTDCPRPKEDIHTDTATVGCNPNS
jgi:hypothetical protein